MGGTSIFFLLMLLVCVVVALITIPFVVVENLLTGAGRRQ